MSTVELFNSGPIHFYCFKRLPCPVVFVLYREIDCNESFSKAVLFKNYSTIVYTHIGTVINVLVSYVGMLVFVYACAGAMKLLRVWGHK